MAEIVNGIECLDGWGERLAAAQQQDYSRDGYHDPRIRYGDEDETWRAVADEHPCHDCAAARGQFHVPGCDVEKCPVCGDQAFLCDCFDELNTLIG